MCVRFGLELQKPILDMTASKTDLNYKKKNILWLGFSTACSSLLLVGEAKMMLFIQYDQNGNDTKPEHSH